jgi:UDP-N-acetylglucosamine 1-carboxyvinyltransferase
MPGGCNFGNRSIGFHLKGLESLGAKINIKGSILELKSDGLQGTEIDLKYPSVGATENIILASVFAEGETRIYNCSIEPEVVCFEVFLSRLGAQIEGIGTRNLVVKGVDTLKKSVVFDIPSDRIEAGTYIVATGMTGGCCKIENITKKEIQDMVPTLLSAGFSLEEKRDRTIKVSIDDRPNPLDVITNPYPGFPTDMQPIITPLLCLANGQSTITENVYENRFQYVGELKKFGSKLQISKNKLFIDGVDKFTPNIVAAKDLRAGVAVILAGLNASGKTIINDIHHVDRGYEDFEHKLTHLGACIVRESYIPDVIDPLRRYCLIRKSRKMGYGQPLCWNDPHGSSRSLYKKGAG